VFKVDDIEHTSDGYISPPVATEVNLIADCLEKGDGHDHDGHIRYGYAIGPSPGWIRIDILTDIQP